MRNRPWQGRRPRDDAEAREWIIDAAMRCIERHGAAKTALSDVALELGVTRQTVYRHFSSSEDLLVAVVQAAADGFVDSLVARARQLSDPHDMLVECLAYTVERLSKDRYLSLVFDGDHSATIARSIVSESAGRDLTHALLRRLGVDWRALGYTSSDLDDVVEIYLRTLQSLALDPGPARSGRQLRRFLDHWMASALRSYGRESADTSARQE